MWEREKRREVSDNWEAISKFKKYFPCENAPEEVITDLLDAPHDAYQWSFNTHVATAKTLYLYNGLAMTKEVQGGYILLATTIR